MSDRSDATGYTVVHDRGVLRVIIGNSKVKGYGAALDIMGDDALKIAFGKAWADFRRNLRMLDDTDADQYRAEWATLADRSPREVYVPEGIRPPGD